MAQDFGAIGGVVGGLGQQNALWWLAGGIVLMIVLVENAPKWGGWILLLLVLGFLLVQAQMGRRLLE